MVIPYGRQSIDEDDIRAVEAVLRSDYITQGPGVVAFEELLAEKCGARYAVAVNSGTAALHVACLAAGLQKDEEVVTSPNTFLASANCAAYCGALPVFADISPDTYNIIPEEIENMMTGMTKMVIPVHFAGQSCDMELIQRYVRSREEAEGRKIYIVEDACHALGSVYNGQSTGSCSYSDMTVMSFHPVKHITTGEGGAVLTNNKELYNKLRRFRNHGITNNPSEIVYPEHAFQDPGASALLMNPWYYEQIDLGYNYRITDLQCVLGSSQLKKLDRFRRRRREIVDMYNDAFKDAEGIQTPFEAARCESNFHLYVLLFEWEKFGTDRARFMTDLRARGVLTQVHYIPVHTQPYYRKTFGTNWGDCPNAEQYYKKCLSIPLYPSMSNEDVQYVINTITEVIHGN